MKTSAPKNRHIHLSGRVYRRFFRTKRSFTQTTRERPVGRSRRRPTADASRLSAGFRAKKPSVDPPNPTNVSDRHRKQTDTQSMPSALSVVRGNECKIIVNEKNAVQFCGSDARYLTVGNYSCCTEHTFHRDRSCAHSNIHSCDNTEYWKRRLMLFPESLWVVFEFRRNPQRQVMIERSISLVAASAADLTGASLQSVPVAVVCA